MTQPICYAQDMIDNFTHCPESNDIAYRYYIYTLNDKTGVRYVGQTNSPSLRLSQHMCKGRSGRDKTKRGRWIKGLVEKKEEPVMVIVETCPIYQANERERFWINHYRQRETSLLNGSRWEK